MVIERMRLNTHNVSLIEQIKEDTQFLKLNDLVCDFCGNVIVVWNCLSRQRSER